jgi:hypothetical protein
VRYFTLRGEVDGAPVRAWWSRGRLIASPALSARAELLVRLGERFGPASGTAVVAGLGRPTAALLTVIRACDRVGEIRIGPMPVEPALRGTSGGRP